jgi:uncharacterized protein (DUF924 family)
MDRVEEVIGFWFGLKPEQWWRSDPELDSEVRERFGPLWEEARQWPVDAFLGSPEEALAAVILFDQFPRNMFRGHADSFATDHLALAIAKAAIERGHDDALPQAQRGFLYMPFQHSEDLDDQLRSVGLFAQLGDPEQLRLAHLLNDVIERFSRFPHRNAILGRKPRPDEIAAGDVVPW